MKLLPLAALVPLLAFAASAGLTAGCDGDLETELPARTVRVVAGPAQLVGSEGTGCSYAPAPSPGAATPPRWCAFYRKAPDGAATELWTVDVSKPLRDGATDTCDGSSPTCRLLTASLWTGDPVFSPSHPYIHGFEGDTLIFYADSASLKSDEAYLGPVRGWRPGLPAAQALTGGRGLLCVGHLRSDGVLCIQNQEGGGDQLQFDLAAGPLRAGTGTLPTIETVRPYDARGALKWQVAFSPGGQHLAFSTQAPDAPVERLRIVETAQIGVTPPVEIARDIARWQFSPDGQRLFFLRGYQYAAEPDATGTLAAADFPAMTNPTDLALRVSRYQVHAGDSANPTPGISLFQDVADSYASFRIMPDISRPAELVTIAQMIEEARVSPDRRFTFFYDFDEMGESISVLARNDGTGRCTLNAKVGHAAFGLVFPGSGPVFWGEDSSDNPAYNEGWFANPVDCGGKQRFSSKLAYLQATRSGAVFGEEEDSRITMTLRHARATMAGAGPLEFKDLASGADTTVALLDDRYVVFTVNQGDPATQGLYIHGPLP